MKGKIELMKDIDIQIDKTKLSSVMEIIEQAAELMLEKDRNNDEKAKSDLEKFQQKLREITGNNKIQIRDFQEYWGYTNLETVAKKALMPPVSKSDVSDEEIKEIVLNILEHEEAEMDWWLDYLTLNTGLSNLTNYIFYPQLVGLDSQATLEQIADKIIADRKQLPIDRVIYLWTNLIHPPQNWIPAATGAASESSKSEKDLLLFLLPCSVSGHFALFGL